jgi:hypothetical protein
LSRRSLNYSAGVSLLAAGVRLSGNARPSLPGLTAVGPKDNERQSRARREPQRHARTAEQGGVFKSGRHSTIGHVRRAEPSADASADARGIVRTRHTGEPTGGQSFASFGPLQTRFPA